MSKINVALYMRDIDEQVNLEEVFKFCFKDSSLEKYYLDKVEINSLLYSSVKNYRELVSSKLARELPQTADERGILLEELEFDNGKSYGKIMEEKINDFNKQLFEFKSNIERIHNELENCSDLAKSSLYAIEQILEEKELFWSILLGIQLVEELTPQQIEALDKMREQEELDELLDSFEDRRVTWWYN